MLRGGTVVKGVAVRGYLNTREAEKAGWAVQKRYKRGTEAEQERYRSGTEAEQERYRSGTKAVQNQWTAGGGWLIIAARNQLGAESDSK